MILKTLIARISALAFGFLVLSCAPMPTAVQGMTAAPTDIPAPTGLQAGCSVVSAPPTPNAASALTAISASDFSRGAQSAAVTLLYYCDFQSAQCEIFNRVLDQLQKNHPSDLRIVMHPFPVPVSVMPSLEKSELSARAALAAAKQGKFWEMRDLLHAQYNSWVTLTIPGFEQWLKGQAAALGLDEAEFKKDLSDPATSTKAKSMYDSAFALGISGIPTVFINGRLQQRPALSYDGLESTISLIALGPRQFKSCPPFDIDPSRQYLAIIHTEKGDIGMRLYADKAPLAVNSFVFLSRQGWFNDVTFHRVVPGFVAQAGDPSGTGRGGPGYFFKNEVRSGMLFDKPGIVAMANLGPDTNGSQFFITYAPEPQLDGAYTIFGQVTQGMDVVERLTPRDPEQASVLTPGDKILSITIQEK